eukprot:SAG22_NODE_2015_length_3137_cov_7.334101_5_plen_47_part_00
MGSVKLICIQLNICESTLVLSLVLSQYSKYRYSQEWITDSVSTYQV